MATYGRVNETGFVYSTKRNCIIDETERGRQIKVSPINSAKWVDCADCKVAEVTWRLSVLDQDEDEDDEDEDE